VTTTKAVGHTPEPWTQDGPRVYGGADCEVVAAVTREADGRVIAAAPRMLEALRMALEALTDGETSEPVAYLPAIRAARAAIAKATGDA
jgi:hypothetical protein